MIVLIPLGGIGERFKKNDYKKPKALIKLFGKPILYYLLDNLKLSDVEFVCIPYNKEYSYYNFQDQLSKDYPRIKFKFLKLTDNTEGAAETINLALKTFECDDKPVLCLDGDNFYTLDVINLWNGENKIITFEHLNGNAIYSYLKIEDNKVKGIIEKDKISNYACTGAYGFSSYKTLLKYTQYVLDNNIKQKGEYYTSNVISEMINDGNEFYYSVIDIKKYHCLGTPIQLKLFYNNFPKISCLNNVENVKKLRICFDFDNTLVTHPKIKDDYKTVEPITKNINFLKYLKTFNHDIIIYTARRMKTHKGNTGKVLCDIGKITFDTLEKFDIPFDEIYFGKPQADVYIDDLALNCFDNMEKELGFYMDKIDTREFNRIEKESIDTIVKKSSDLSGEIYYYKNIPPSLKDLFPILIDYDTDNKWFKIENIVGLTMTNLYLSELLTEEMLIHVMKTIQRIQNTSIEMDESNNTNIYENYSNKIKERYKSYDYSVFENSEEIYNYLIEKMNEYENETKGKKVIIHGDAVMTNIIINYLGKIKMIDIRGKIGKTLTIYGDWLYDWAKLYQSLIGYDKILQDKNVSDGYEKRMIKVFENFFLNVYTTDDMRNLKIKMEKRL
jgi:capsule biosynthesis phosphatase